MTQPEDRVMIHPAWTLIHPRMTTDMLGYVPLFFDTLDPRSAREQINTNYSHGGGWHPIHGFEMLPNGNLKYPGDPPTRLLAETKLRGETIRFYEHSWLLILQPDGTWEVSRCD